MLLSFFGRYVARRIIMRQYTNLSLSEVNGINKFQFLFANK